ncbi:AmmeMemoRadiSam system protein A [Nitrosomonas sp.]|uniref:AmmeMemoRadiSam system protein A n=1 Tax=Nitrosomonas sp. TaxID=42353 RepID=UPI00284910C0|nr:AmmeMemoRadiSam system protein A [Nitrosomonas sp.]MDR4513259.1 AmmeMemoRadiSam system protein A [Nitrosomonas sp.]
MLSNIDQNERGRILLSIARRSIADALQIDTAGDVAFVDTMAQWLAEPGATFITLTQQQRLRGCIGSLQAHQSLLENVRRNAVAAALHDNRFSPVTVREFASIDIEASLLSALEPLTFVNEKGASSQLRPGIDGVILTWGVHRSTFLPQVWDSLPQTHEFLVQLKLKAGLDADFWDDAICLSRYTVQKWRETDFGEEINNG